MANVLDDEAISFLALANSEGQFSLWPAHLPIPNGWRSDFGPDARAACVAHVEAAWVDLRPLSLQAVANDA